MRKRGWITGIALLILLLLTAAGSAYASETDRGMVSDTIMWQMDDSGVLTLTGNGAMPDYTRGTQPWSRYKTRITTVLFYGDITRIGNYSFADCTKITHAAFPRTLKNVGKGAFSGCILLADSDTAAQSWSVPEYRWSADYSTLTATRTSNLDPSVTETETVNATATVKQELTCLQDGIITYTSGEFQSSIFKGQTITVTTPTPGHVTVIQERVEPTCTGTGLTEGSYCQVCQTVFAVQEVIPANGHSMNHIEAADSTCVKHGCLEHWHCSACEKDFTDEAGTAETDAELPLIPHMLSQVEEKASSCTEPGYDAHWHCSACGKDFGDEQGETEVNAARPLAPHTLTAHEAKAPKCEPGNIAWWECTECRQCFSDENAEHTIAREDTVLPAEHSLLESTPIEATCISDGRKPFWWCEDCGRLFADAEAKEEKDDPGEFLIPRTGHAEHPEYYPVAEATCTEAGRETEYWYCPQCQVYFADAALTVPFTERPEETAPLGHEWGAPEYTWSADLQACTAKRTCIRNHSETENGTVTVKITVPATSEAEGKAVCTATFTNPVFAAQTREKTLPKSEPAKPPAGSYQDKTTGTYVISTDGTATFKKAAKAKATVTVPDTIRVKGFDVPVTAIADKAFSKDTKLTSITIGSNVRTIGKNAFSGCTKLKTVKGGKNVETIKDSAFNGCAKLAALPAFPKLKTIGANAFKGCKALAKVTIGAKVKAIGKNAFSGCAALKTITIKSTLLTKGNVKSGAFKGIHARATVKCPKKQLKAYKKFLPGKGVPKTATIK